MDVAILWIVYLIDQSTICVEMQSIVSSHDNNPRCILTCSWLEKVSKSFSERRGDMQKKNH